MELKSYTAGGLNPTTGSREALPRAGGMDGISTEMRRMALNMAASRDEDDYQSAQLAFVKGVNSLDEEFDKDEDFATLGKRRAEKLKALSDSLYEGKSGRVQEKLKNHFELASERDGIKWTAIVNKKDSTQRVARFHEDTDEYLNHMIQAPTDEAHAKAQGMWDARLEAIKPHMAPAAFVQMRDRHRDNVKFKRAWGKITGESEFDPTPFMDLNPDQLGQLEARHHGIKRDNERKFREHQVDRTNVLLPRLEDSLASAMNEGVPMDGTEDMLRELGGLGERGAAIKTKFEGQFSRAYRARDTMDSVKFKPFSEQMQMVETLRPEPGSDGYQDDMAMYQRAGQMVMQRAKAFQGDQAGFVQPEAERRAREAADSWVKDEDLGPFVLRASMDLQKEFGAAEPKVLSTGQAKGLKDKYERADGDGKAEILQGLGGYGEFDRQALAELGLGLGHTFMAEVYMDDPILGRKALDVAAMKESDIAVSPEVATSIKKDIGSAFHEGPGELFTQLYNLTGNPAHQELSKQLYDMTMKMGLAGGDASGAMARLWNDRFEFLADDDVLIYTPKDIDADDVAGKLREYRRSLPEEFGAFKDGVWKNADNGTGFVLVLPHGGAAMSRDGKIVVVGYDELDSLVATSQNFQSVYGVGDLDKVMRAHGSNREVGSPMGRE
ncbi:MAG: hypothetical protein JEY79_01005 [Pseudodesulfovibrio sp.]|nr:hypothetical protein [Pseudodesulfovibrio sp.]